MLTVRVDAPLADRLRRLDTTGLIRVVTSGPAGFVVTTVPDPDADVVLAAPAAVDAVWQDRLGPFAAALTGAAPESGPAVPRDHDPAWAAAARRRLDRLRL